MLLPPHAHTEGAAGTEQRELGASSGQTSTPKVWEPAPWALTRQPDRPWTGRTRDTTANCTPLGLRFSRSWNVLETFHVS